MTLPAGFDGVYRCKRHPEREAVAPIALRLCAQCLEDAHARYADYDALREDAARDSRADYQRTPWGERTDAKIPRKPRTII